MSSVPPHGIRVPILHGRRRAEEKREAAMMVGDSRIAPRMATATADVQEWIATLRAEGVFATASADAGWRELADLVRCETDG